MADQPGREAPKQQQGKPETALQTFHSSVERMGSAIAETLPQGSPHEKAARIQKGVLLAAEANPDLYECTAASVQFAVLKAAQFGLIPGIGNECYLIPYGDKCEFMLGYAGFLQLIRRSNEIRFCQAKVVKAGDQFEITEAGPNRGVIHKPKVRGRGKRGKTVGAYFECYLKGDELPYVEWMDVEQLQKVRAASKAPNSPAWKNWEDEMYRAKVTRRGCKWVPISPDAMELIESSDHAEFGMLFDKAVESAAQSARERIREPEAIDAE